MLPTHPARLEPKLRAGSQRNQDYSQYAMMNLLAGTPAPPSLREALFKVAAQRAAAGWAEVAELFSLTSMFRRGL